MWRRTISNGSATRPRGKSGKSCSTSAMPRSLRAALARTTDVGTSAAVWFRRDLRVHDHPALWTAVAEYDHVVPVFVLDDVLLGGRYRSDARARWMLACLEEL